MKRRTQGSFALFDITYADGSRSSNRKVPLSVVEGLDGEEGAREIIETQDRTISAASGRPAGVITAMIRRRGV